MVGFVYIETTIFSLYHDTRRSPAIMAMRLWTREWWERWAKDYTAVTSVAVRGELERGRFPHQAEALGMATPELVTPLELMGDMDT